MARRAGDSGSRKAFRFGVFRTDAGLGLRDGALACLNRFCVEAAAERRAHCKYAAVGVRDGNPESFQVLQRTKYKTPIFFRLHRTPSGSTDSILNTVLMSLQRRFPEQIPAMADYSILTVKWERDLHFRRVP